MANDMKDWPLALKRNVAVIELAAEIYRKHCIYHRVPDVGFETLPPRARDRYVGRAKDMLEGLGPASVLPYRNMDDYTSPRVCWFVDVPSHPVVHDQIRFTDIPEHVTCKYCSDYLTLKGTRPTYEQREAELKARSVQILTDLRTNG